jgi:hypothetical protein
MEALVELITATKKNTVIIGDFSLVLNDLFRKVTDFGIITGLIIYKCTVRTQLGNLISFITCFLKLRMALTYIFNNRDKSDKH